MLISMENLDDYIGFAISDDSFFSEGTAILLDGGAWVVAEIVGCDVVLNPSNDHDDAEENMHFFLERAE